MSDVIDFDELREKIEPVFTDMENDIKTEFKNADS